MLKSAKSRNFTFLALGGLSLLSLCFITFVDNIAAQVIASVSDRYVWVAQARFPSFLLSLALLLCIDRSALRFDRLKFRWKAVTLTSIFWLAPAALGVFGLRVWIPRIDGWIDITAFMVTGLCAEEFLFRGSLYALSLKAFGSKEFLKIPIPVIYTALFFSAQHLQYHSFVLTTPAVTQMAYTFVMGIFFGLVRHHGGGIWPPVFVHMLNNSFTLVRNYQGNGIAVSNVALEVPLELRLS